MGVLPSVSTNERNCRHNIFNPIKAPGNILKRKNVQIWPCRRSPGRLKCTEPFRKWSNRSPLSALWGIKGPPFFINRNTSRKVGGFEGAVIWIWINPTHLIEQRSSFDLFSVRDESRVKNVRTKRLVLDFLNCISGFCSSSKLNRKVNFSVLGRRSVVA